MALSPSETTFIATHQAPVVKGMKPYLLRDQFIATGKPFCSVSPVVTGTAVVGQVLSCSTGTWLNSPTFTYQWLRAGVPIAGATAATYTVVTADAGQMLFCLVTGTAGGGSFTAASNSVRVAVPFAGPNLVSFNPVDNLIGEPIMADLIATFDVPVTLGSGLVYLKKTTDGSVVASWNAAYAGSTPGRMEVVGGTAMTMHMQTPLTSGVEYYVTWDIGIVVDASARPAAALISTTAWSFIAAIPVASPEVYLDFAANTSLVNGTPGTAAALLTTTRVGTAYVDNLAGTWASVAANTARISNKGLLVEEARTNGTPNNSMQGCVPGSPGTPPTNWQIVDRFGLSHTIVGVGVENGIDYIDIRIFGTSTSTGGGRYILFQGDTQVAAVNGQLWTGSAFVTLVAGALNGVTWQQYLIENTAAGALITQTVQAFVPVAGALGSNRISVLRGNNQPTVAFEQYYFVMSVPSVGLAVDFTIRVGWPQLELGAFATSPIRTTAAAVTRATDVVTLTTPPAFGSAFTLYAAGVPAGNSLVNAAAIEAYLDPNNRALLYRGTAQGSTTGMVVGGSFVYNPFGATWALNTAGKLAAGFTASNYAMAFNGVTTVGTQTASYMTPVAANIGTRQGGSLPFDGYITQAAIWATARLSNAQLQQISSAGVTP